MIKLNDHQVKMLLIVEQILLFSAKEMYSKWYGEYAY